MRVSHMQSMRPECFLRHYSSSTIWELHTESKIPSREQSGNTRRLNKSKKSSHSQLVKSVHKFGSSYNSKRVLLIGSVWQRGKLKVVTATQSTLTMATTKRSNAELVVRIPDEHLLDNCKLWSFLCCALWRLGCMRVLTFPQNAPRACATPAFT